MKTAFSIVLAFVFLLWGAIAPRPLWQLLAGWRYRNPEAVEPSDAVYKLWRFGSIVGLAAMLCGGVIVLVDRPKSGSEPAAEAPATFDLTVRPTAVHAAFDADEGDFVLVPEQVTAPGGGHPVKVLHRRAVDDTETPDWLTGGNHLAPGTRLVVSVGYAASPSALVVQDDADRVTVTVYTNCGTCPTAPPASPDPGATVHVYLVPVSLRAPLGTRPVIDGSTGAKVA